MVSTQYLIDTTSVNRFTPLFIKGRNCEYRFEHRWVTAWKHHRLKILLFPINFDKVNLK